MTINAKSCSFWAVRLPAFPTPQHLFDQSLPYNFDLTGWQLAILNNTSGLTLGTLARDIMDARSFAMLLSPTLNGDDKNQIARVFATLGQEDPDLSQESGQISLGPVTWMSRTNLLNIPKNDEDDYAFYVEVVKGKKVVQGIIYVLNEVNAQHLATVIATYHFGVTILVIPSSIDRNQSPVQELIGLHQYLNPGATAIPSRIYSSVEEVFEAMQYVAEE